MTPEICRELAAALRSLIEATGRQFPYFGSGMTAVPLINARDALQKYDDLPKNMAGEYRVFWEIDALDAETPREAAQEAWRAMRRMDSQANVFTVMPPDGMLHTIDLGEDPP